MIRYIFFFTELDDLAINLHKILYRRIVGTVDDDGFLHKSWTAFDILKSGMESAIFRSHDNRMPYTILTISG
jgi:hypothetical protein